MRQPRLFACAVLALAVATGGCQTGAGGIAAFVPGVGSSKPTPPETVREQAGKGRVPVYGASLYGPGQQIYKELRQEDSLMAFLACQGEPDQVEVVPNPGAPKIYLYYSRRGLSQTGTVEIVPTDGGFYAARPIDPKDRGPTPPPPLPKAKPRPRTQPKLLQPKPEPEPEVVTEPESEVAPEAPQEPEPTRQQLDDCPIEPWRADCREFCTSDEAPWEWCNYGE